jgi:hypothetical protein
MKPASEQESVSVFNLIAACNSTGIVYKINVLQVEHLIKIQLSGKKFLSLRIAYLGILFSNNVEDNVIKGMIKIMAMRVEL